MALTKISTGGVKDDAASQAKIADEAVDEARLQVSNAGTNGQFLQKQSSNAGGLTWATVTVPDSDKIEEGNTSIETVDTGSDGHVKISTEGTERLRVVADGKIGIGSTNPQDYLDLGNATGGKGIAWGGSSGQAHYSTIWSEYSSGSLVLAAGLKGSTTNTDFVVPWTGTMGYAAIELDSFNDDGIKFYTAPDAAKTKGDAVTKNERFRIGPSGQLGIGGATYGSDGQVLTSKGASAAPEWADAGGGGLTEIDAWCLSSSWPTPSSGSTWSNVRLGNASNTTGTGTFTRNSEHNMPIGTGVTNTNGLFTFPSTGTWEVTCQLYVKRYYSTPHCSLDVTLCGTNAAGSGMTFAQQAASISSDCESNPISMSGIVKVTNTSTQNVWVRMSVDNYIYIIATSKQNMIFKKLT